MWAGSSLRWQIWIYCTPRARGYLRRVLHQLIKDTLILLAPILSFTSEEAWEFLPDFTGKEPSIHLHLFSPAVDTYEAMIDREKWDGLIGLRERILKEIEDQRNNKTIGDSLEAEILLELPDSLFDLAADNGDLLKEILVVS